MKQLLFWALCALAFAVSFALPGHGYRSDKVDEEEVEVVEIASDTVWDDSDYSLVAVDSVPSIEELWAEFEKGDLESGRDLVNYYEFMGFQDSVDIISLRLADLGDEFYVLSDMVWAFQERDTARALKRVNQQRSLIKRPYSEAISKYVADRLTLPDSVPIYKSMIAGRPSDAALYFALGTYYYNGYCGHEDKDSALACFKKAAALGYPDAIAMTGSVYYNDMPDRDPDFSVSKRWFEKADSAGSAFGAYFKAVLHDEGVVYDRDEKKVVELYERAVRKGYVSALYNYGMDLVEGTLGKVDVKRGLKLLEAADEKNHFNAAVQLGHYYREGEYVGRDIVKAREWYIKGMKQGNVNALRAMTQTYLLGKDYDIDKAKDLIIEDRALNDASGSRSNLELLHMLEEYLDLVQANGGKIPEEANEHARFLMQCKLYNIGDSYNPEDVHALCEKYMRQDSAFAWDYAYYLVQRQQVDVKRLMALIDDYGLDMEDYVKVYLRLAPFEKSMAGLKARAQRGDSQALFDLAQCYQYGVGVPVNVRKARRLYTNAANLGHPEAMESLVSIMPDNTAYSRQLNYWRAKAGMEEEVDIHEIYGD